MKNCSEYIPYVLHKPYFIIDIRDIIMIYYDHIGKV